MMVDISVTWEVGIGQQSKLERQKRRNLSGGVRLHWSMRTVVTCQESYCALVTKTSSGSFAVNVSYTSLLM